MLLILTVLVYKIFQKSSKNLLIDLLLVNLLLQKIFIEYKHMIQQCVYIFLLDLQTFLVLLDLQTFLVNFDQIIFKNDDIILNYFKIE